MALKEVKRPTGLIPSWANDDNLDDPGEPWDGNPTKVEPGAGKRDDGHLPDEDIDAQHVNHLLNEQGKWIQFFSDIQIQNWLIPNTMPTTTPNTGNCVTWDQGATQWVVCGDALTNDIRADFSENGHDWVAEDEPAISSLDPEYCFSKPASDAPTHGGSFVIAIGDSDTRINELRSGTWTSTNLAGDDDSMRGGVWDPSNQLLLLGGHNDAGPPVEPIFYHSVSTAFSWTRVVPAFSNSETVVDVQTDGSGLSLAVGDQTDGDTWTSTNGTAWTLRTTTIDDMRACWFNPDAAAGAGLWMIVTNNEVFTSPDAINWSLASTLLSGTFQFHTLRGFGSLWVCGSGSDSAILFSTDDGANWRHVPVPSGLPNNPPTGLEYSPVDRKFMAVFQKTVDGIVNMSLSLGTSARNSTLSSLTDVPSVT